MGNQPADRRSRAFCLHQVDCGSTGYGEEGHNKNKDTHTTDPVREASPHQACVGECFHIGKDTRSGCSEAGDRFKQCICIGRNVSADHKRQCTDDT